MMVPPSVYFYRIYCICGTCHSRLIYNERVIWAMATLILNRFILHIRSIECRQEPCYENDDDYSRPLREEHPDVGGNTAGDLDATELVARSASRDGQCTLMLSARM